MTTPKLIADVLRNCIEIERKRAEHYGDDNALKTLYAVAACFASAMTTTPTKILSLRRSEKEITI